MKKSIVLVLSCFLALTTFAQTPITPRSQGNAPNTVNPGTSQKTPGTDPQNTGQIKSVPAITPPAQVPLQTIPTPPNSLGNAQENDPQVQDINNNKSGFNANDKNEITSPRVNDNPVNKSEVPVTTPGVTLNRNYYVQNGRILYSDDGKITPVDGDITLPNGTVIMKNGTYKNSDGKVIQLKDGQKVDTDGKIIDSKSK